MSFKTPELLRMRPAEKELTKYRSKFRHPIIGYPGRDATNAVGNRRNLASHNPNGILYVSLRKEGS